MKNNCLISLMLFGFCFSQEASAYLDPGAGSLIIQMLIAGIMGALFTIKLYWNRLKSFISNLFNRNVDIKEHEEESDLED